MKYFLMSVLSLLFTCALLGRAEAYSPIPRPDMDYTDLHKAAEACDLEKERVALDALSSEEKAAEINRLDREGFTPLAYAARAGCLDIVKLLVERGASVDAAEERYGWTPLLRAADQRHADVVRYLLDHGANPNYKTDIGKTPLSVALMGTTFTQGPEGEPEATLKALLEKNADISVIFETYDDIRSVVSDEGKRIVALEEQCRSLEAEVRRLNEVLEEIRSQVGSTTPRPT